MSEPKIKLPKPAGHVIDCGGYDGSMPWWAECRWPLGLVVTFACDCETFWENGYQQMHPLWRIEPTLMRVEPKNGAIKHALLVGAPTSINTDPRPLGAKPQPTEVKLQAIQCS